MQHSLVPGFPLHLLWQGISRFMYNRCVFSFKVMGCKPVTGWIDRVDTARSWSQGWTLWWVSMLLMYSPLLERGDKTPLPAWTKLLPAWTNAILYSISYQWLTVNYEWLILTIQWFLQPSLRETRELGPTNRNCLQGPTSQSELPTTIPNYLGVVKWASTTLSPPPLPLLIPPLSGWVQVTIPPLPCPHQY